MSLLVFEVRQLRVKTYAKWQINRKERTLIKNDDNVFSLIKRFF